MTLLTPFQLTPLGLFHTILSIVCVVGAFVALSRDRGISPRTSAGRFYLVTLWITLLTGFPILRTGALATPPFILGVVSVIVLIVAALAGQTRLFGRASACVETLSYSLTVFLLMVPTVTETLTRVPPSAPLVAGPESPALLPFHAFFFLLFLVGATRQVKAVRTAIPAPAAI